MRLEYGCIKKPPRVMYVLQRLLRFSCTHTKLQEGEESLAKNLQSTPPLPACPPNSSLTLYYVLPSTTPPANKLSGNLTDGLSLITICHRLPSNPIANPSSSPIQFSPLRSRRPSISGRPGSSSRGGMHSHWA